MLYLLLIYDRCFLSCLLPFFLSLLRSFLPSLLSFLHVIVFQFVSLSVLSPLEPADCIQCRMRKRKAFEDSLRRSRMKIGIWLKYASWEASQLEFDR